MNLNIGLAKDGLLFHQPQRPFYENATAEFKNLLQQKFTSIIGKVAEQDNSLYEKGLLKQTEIASSGCFENLFSTPEFISKILEYPYESATKIYSFFLKSADAEIARTTGVFKHDEYPYLWTANGDYFIRYDSESKIYNEYSAFTLNNQVVLDFFSPNCIRIDGQELEGNPALAIEEYNYEEAFSLYERLEEILSPLYNFPNSAIDLITIFTRVIILKKQASTGNVLFSSASLYPFIGRSLLINADKAHASQVVDGLVHEAIHSLLYTIDAVEKWMPTNATIRKLGSIIVSPWTGRLLDLGNFCQAIFVWYGLFNFWSLALQFEVYDKEYAEKRIHTIKNGFKQVEVFELSKIHNLQLNETFMNTVEAIKDFVLNNDSSIVRELDSSEV